MYSTNFLCLTEDDTTFISGSFYEIRVLVQNEVESPFLLDSLHTAFYYTLLIRDAVNLVPYCIVEKNRENLL